MSNETTSPRLIIPALGGLWEWGSKYAYTVVRIVTGAMLIPHGFQKLFEGAAGRTAFFMTMVFEGMSPDQIKALPAAERADLIGSYIGWAYYLGILEFVGGIMLVIGLLTRVIAVQVLGFMLVATFVAHWSNGFVWINRGWEYPAMWAVLALVVLFRGGGERSVDRLIGWEF